ncbi:hypothetical protein C6P40_004124, partial [Pichia californica]
MVWMGTGGFDCCNPKLSQLGTADTAVLLASKNSASNVQESYVYLEKDNYYPIRIVYINAVSDGQLKFDIVDPSGKVADISSYVYQIEGDLKGMQCTYHTAYATMGTVTYFNSEIYPGTTLYAPITTTDSAGSTTVIIGETIGAELLTETYYETVTYSGKSVSSTVVTVATVKNGVEVGEIVETVYVPSLSVSTSTWTYAWDGSTTTTAVIKEADGSVVTTTYIILEVPPLSTTYIGWKSTGYSTYTTTNAYGSSEVVINGPEISTSTSTGNWAHTFTTTATINEADGSIVTSIYVVDEVLPLSTTYIGWDSTGYSTYTSTNSQGSSEVVINGPSVSTSFSTWNNNWYVTMTTTATIVEANGSTVTSTYVIVDVPPLTTDYSAWDSSVYSTVTTTNAQGSSEVIIYGPAMASVTTTWNNNWKASSTVATVINEGDGSLVTSSYIEVFIPAYSVSAVQWNKKYTSTETLTTDIWGAESLYLVEYVPSYAVSYSYWDKNYDLTSTYALTLTDKLGVYTTTLVSIFAPSLSITTTTWEKPYTSTITSYQTFSSNGEHFTSSEIIVEIPDTKAVQSWSTIYITSSDCDASGASTAYSTTTIAGVETTIGYEYVTTPVDTCYLPPAATTSTTVTTEATDCTLAT